MQSFRATYGCLGINSPAGCWCLGKKFAHLIGTAKNQLRFARRWHEEWACEGWLMGTSQPVWPVLRNGRYMMPAHMMSTELVAYLSLPCW